jgi:hypothetical protein
VLVRFLEVAIEMLVADVDPLNGELIVRQAVTAAAGVFDGLEKARPQQVADHMATLTQLRGQIDGPPRPAAPGDELRAAALEMLVAQDAYRQAATPDNASRLSRARRAVRSALHGGNEEGQ